MGENKIYTHTDIYKPREREIEEEASEETERNERPLNVMQKKIEREEKIF